jgi:hypothetical protein
MRLRGIATLAWNYIDDGKGDEVSKCVSCEEFMQYAIHHGFLEYNAKFDHDSWNHPYRWKAIRDAKRTIIRVMSDGPDGISQDGEGDDLWVEIVYQNGKDGHMNIKPP